MAMLLRASLDAAPACDGATLRTSPRAASVGSVLLRPVAWAGFGGVVRGGGGGGNGGCAAATVAAAVAAVLGEVVAPSVPPKVAVRRMRGTAGDAMYGEAGVEAIEAAAIESEARVAPSGSPPAASPEPSSVTASRGAGCVGCTGCVAGLTGPGAQMAPGA